MEGDNTPLPAGKSLTLPAGKTVPVGAMLIWNLSDDPPPLVAIISASFTLRHKGQTVLTTPAYVLAANSKPGALDDLMKNVSKRPGEDAELLRVLRAMDAKPSASIQDLLRRLETSLPPAEAREIAGRSTL